jgi:heme/copper-type cytochrome/quinol oxidase subunit 3
MTQTISVAIIVIKTAILILGSGIAYIAYKAHRRTESPSLRALAFGFGVITVGALLAGIAHQLLGVGLRTGILINSVLTALGFVIIIYSLYIER